MSYIVICQKPDGSIDVAAHPGEAAPELLQDAQPAKDMDEALQLAKEVLEETGEDASQEDEGGESTATEGLESAAGVDAADGDEGDPSALPATKGPLPGAEGMPMQSEDDQMAAGFKRAKKGY